MTFVPSEIDSYVGCETRFNVTAKDLSGTYAMVIDTEGTLPEGARVTPTALAPQRNAITGLDEQVYVVYFSLTPTRGSEGSRSEVCFTSTDALRTQVPLPKQCWTMTVQRCQYCIAQGDTLSLVSPQYFCSFVLTAWALWY